MLIMAAPVAAYIWLRQPDAEISAPIEDSKAVEQDETYAPAFANLPPEARQLQTQLSALAKGFDGDVGIAVRSVTGDWTAGHNLSQPFPQQSVSKLWVAATVMGKVDKAELKLTDTIPLTSADLTIFHQPVRKYILAQGAQEKGAWRPRIEQLLWYAMTQSDNAANDALFRHVGGQQGVQAFLSEKRLTGIRMSAGEKELQMAIAGMAWRDTYSYGRSFWTARELVPFRTRQQAIAAYLANPMDGATPLAVAQGLGKLANGTLLSPKSSAYLIGLMNQSKTGPKRLRGGLSKGWTLAHKTGTGQVLKQLATAYNDVGILTSPSGRRYALVVMIGSTNRSVEERQNFMQAVTRTVIEVE